MAHMAGRFAGILQVSVGATDADALTRALLALDSHGLKLHVERQDQATDGPGGQCVRIELVGPDRIGVIREVSSALAEKRINVERGDPERCEAEANEQSNHQHGESGNRKKRQSMDAFRLICAP